MSTKKDKFSPKDKRYMLLALKLASARKGLTGDNPAVGCVLVKKDKIISIGQTGYGGTPHAEYNAIKNSFQKIDGSKMYVTLEPCNHYGKTPPCTKSIINSGVKEVYYAIDDIDKKVRGKTYKILSNKKIKVKKGLLKKDAKIIYKSYYFNRIKKLPYVTAKIAISKNNLIYSKGVKKITDNISDRLTHFLRFKNDAILVSSKTLNIDNSKLNCRLKGYENFSPKRIILDRNLKIRQDCYILKTVKKNNTIIFYNTIDKKKIIKLRKKGVILIKSNLTKNKRFDLRLVLKKLYFKGVRNLLVEGGDKITKSFLVERLINQFYLFKSPNKLSKNKNHVIFSSINILNNKYKNNYKKSSNLAKDKITIFKR